MRNVSSELRGRFCSDAFAHAADRCVALDGAERIMTSQNRRGAFPSLPHIHPAGGEFLKRVVSPTTPRLLTCRWSVPCGFGCSETIPSPQFCCDTLNRPARVVLSDPGLVKSMGRPSPAFPLQVRTLISCRFRS